jgi:translation elongation factor EF-1alpha
MDEVIVGRITHYFHQVAVAAVEVVADEIRVGDTIRVLGATSNFTQQIHSMEMDHSPVDAAHNGELVGIQVVDRARVGDLVFRISPHTHIDGVSIGPEQGPAA